MPALDARASSRLYLPGTTDRLSQLLYISVADGGNNSTMGYNAASRVLKGTDNVFVGADVAELARSMSRVILIGSGASKYSDRFRDTVGIGSRVLERSTDIVTSVVVGARAGRNMRSTEQSVAIGYKAMENLRDGSFDVAIGSGAASDAINVGNVVFVGAFAGQSATDVNNATAVGYRAGDGFANVGNVVVVGFDAGKNMRNGGDSVVVGAAAGRTFEGSFNTVIGAGCAGNAIAQYSTVVGSRSMNRRDAGQVSLRNCVVVGENVQFDNPIETVTLRIVDAVYSSITGRFGDATHPFPDEYVSFSPDGGLVFPIEESRFSALDDAERSFDAFFALRLPFAASTYTFSWNAEIDDAFAVVEPPFYRVVVTSTSLSSTRMQSNVSVVIGGVVTSYKLYAATFPNNITDPANYPYFDVRVTQAFDISSSIRVEGSMYQRGIPIAIDATTPVLVDPSGQVAGGLSTTFVTYSASIDDHPPVSYAVLRAQDVGGETAAYAIMQHSRRVDNLRTFVSVPIGSFETTSGATIREFVPGFPEIVLVDAPGRTGLVQAAYQLGQLNVSIDTSSSFVIPPNTDGEFGLRLFEWYTLRCTVRDGGTGFGMRVAGPSDELVFAASDTELVAADGVDVQLFGEPETIPIVLGDIRAATDEVFVQVRVQWEIDTPETGIVVTLTFLGYDSGTYEVRVPPRIQRSLRFVLRDPGVPSTDALSGANRDVVVYADATSGVWTVRDINVQGFEIRPTPEFENCVFLGSNFTVENLQDRSNVFLLSLGSSKTLMRGTPTTLEINASSTSIAGSLMIGDSDTTNYMAFRGTRDDGFLENKPRAYVGERIYDPETQRSELLLIKGDDPPGDVGPDRIRMVSGQFRVDVPSAVAASGSYAYTNADVTFENIGNAETTPLVISDGVVGTQLWIGGGPNAAPTLASTLAMALSESGDGVDVRVRDANAVLHTIPLQFSTGDEGVLTIDDVYASNVYASNRVSVGGNANTNPSWPLYVQGDGVFTGNVVACASDERLKTNIRCIEDPLPKLESLRGVTFEWRDDVPGLPMRGPDVGVIAQDVQRVFPQAVRPAPFDPTYLTVDVTGNKLMALLIESVKELSVRVRHLEASRSS